MVKRKEEEGASADLPPVVVVKRPRRNTNSLAQNIDHPRISQEIYDALRTLKGEDGRVVCEAFLRAPSRRTSPEYHKLVANPIDFMRIQQKLKTDEYDTVDQFGVDFRLLVENAKSFYKKNSQEYKDASLLLNVYNEVRSKYFDTDDQSEANNSGRSRDSSPAPSTRSLRSNSPSRSVRSKDTSSPGRFSVGGSDPVDRSVLEIFLGSILELVDETGRPVCQAFKLLPSREDYPDYFDVIKDPVDLRTIAERLRNGSYHTINDMERELTAMCRNAKIYNEPKSLIYKDANFIKKFVARKRLELMEIGAQPADKKRTEVCSNLIDDLMQSIEMDVDRSYTPEDLNEDSDDDDKEMSMNNPNASKLHVLYSTVRYARDEGVELSEPFLRLPDKTFYPDYYDEIKQPISLFMINRKMKMQEYKNLEEMVADMNLMFNNAKLYNIEGSTIYTNACKLQHITNMKTQTLDPSIETSQYVIDVPMDVMYGGDTEDSEQGGRSPATSPTTKMAKSRGGGASGDKPRGRPGRKSLDELMVRYRNKLFMLYNAVVDYKDSNGRVLSEAFMEKPSRKLYPDYYEVIEKPIDLKTIFANIENDKYSNTAAITEDFELLFNNARTYNQEESQIFNDANKLSWVFSNALRQLGPAGIESPKSLKEKFGWRTLFSWSKGRMPGAPSMKDALSGQVSLSPNGGAGPLSPTGGGSRPPRSDKAIEKAAKRVVFQRHKKMMALYNAIKDYKDAKGRQLSSIFMKLPSKTEYPDYYEIIKKPIDMPKIYSKLTSTSNQYDSFDALVQDFVLMFDNATKYNDPESTIYKDSLALQQLLLQKKSELKDEESISKVPDVQAYVQELLTNLFITVYNHQDTEGRCFSDSLAELPDLIRDKDTSMAPVSLDEIKRNLDKGRYRRLDRFQQDVFDVFEKARQLSRSDSEIFEDAVELQDFFIKTRDDLCKNGKVYYSPALLYDQQKLVASLEGQKNEKQKGERTEDEAQPEDPRLAPTVKKEGDLELEFVEENGVRFCKGDFVYVERNDDKIDLEPHIMRVVRIWRDQSQRQDFVSGNWFYRPYETFHLARRKFLEKEVFRTDIFDTVDVERLIGKCYVLFVKDYFKYKPVGFEDNDVYCCESKYLGRMKHSFKKMKYWHIDMTSENVTLEERPTPLTANRVLSMFVGEKAEDLKNIDDKDSDDEDYSVLEVKRIESVIEKVEGGNETGAIYYEQLHCNGLWFRLGDGVYVRTDKALADVIRIDRLWKNPDGSTYLAGVCFARPHDVSHDIKYLYYKKELFATDRVGIAPMSQVLGKCLILSFSDYCTMRPVEYREQDVFICESSAPYSSDFASPNPSEHDYQEPSTSGQTSQTNQQQQSNTAVLRSFKLVPFSWSENVLPDEILYFKVPVVPEKVTAAWHLQEESAAAASERQICEISSVVSDLDKSELSLLKGLTSTPKLGARSKSGYILFSAVIRKKIMLENPDCQFGVISKLVGAEWKKLTEDDKKRYEEEASKIAAAREKADLAAGGRLAVQPGQMRIWMCKWRDCDYQFETSDQLYEHITNVHTSQIMEGGENQFVCLWLTCAKYRKDGKPFPSLPRLHRHMKEKHIPTSSKCIYPQNKSKHYVPLGATSPPPSTPQPCSTPSQYSNSVSYSSATPAAVPLGQQIIQFQSPAQAVVQQSGTSRVVVDAQGNVVPGQVVVYQLQSNATTRQNIQQQPVVATSRNMQAQPSIATSVQQQPPTVVVQPSLQQQNSDPGRVVVQASKPVEPVFVAPPQRIQRVLHSDAYLRYLETLNNPAQTSVSRWDRYLAAHRSNTAIPAGSRLPGNVFNRKPDNKEDLVQALWNLRDHLMRDNLQLKRVLSPEDY